MLCIHMNMELLDINQIIFYLFLFLLLLLARPSFNLCFLYSIRWSALYQNSDC